MEAEPDGHGVVRALVRLFAGARYDVGGYRHQACAMAPDPLRRQAAGAAKRHRAYPQDDPVQEDRARQGHATEAFRQRPLQRPGQPPPDEVCGRTLLAASGAGAAEASPRRVDYRIAMVTPPTAAEAS